MKKDAILKLARARMDEAVQADRENRGRAMDDLEKLIGKHWPEEILRERESEKKPVLTINELPQFVRQVTGDIRRMNPAIKVSPSDNKASKETADLMEGLIRHIEQASDASAVYEMAAESAAACGFGYFRVDADWESDDSFDQVLRINSIRNAFSVYTDPAAQKPTREDAEFAFVTEQMRKEEFEEAFPGKAGADAEHDAETDGLEHWHENGKVVVAEYIWKQYTTRKLLQLVDGSTLFEDEAEKDIPAPAIRRTREVQSPKVMWAKISGQDVLEGPRELPCKYIPIIAVVGEEWHVGEEVYRSGVIRHAKDSAQLLNYAVSSQAETVSLQSKSPYVGTMKQFQGLTDYWKNANLKNYAFLPYIPDDKAPGPPQRQAPPLASAGLSELTAFASASLRSTTGIYNAALGERSSETSGVAIRQRQMESDTATSIYSDNMAKAIAHCGRVLLSMIPRIYDTARVVRILGEDGAEKAVPINGVVVQDGQEMPVNDLTVGKYDLRVSVGPNYSTKRQETAEGMLEFMRVVPGAGQVMGDMVAKSMDWPEADRLAERLQKLLPPGLAETDDPQQAAMQQQAAAQQAQMAQAMQMAEIQKATAEAAEAQADAKKTEFEAQEAGLEVAMKSGAMNAAIQRIVQAEVARVLQSTMAPRGVI